MLIRQKQTIRANKCDNQDGSPNSLCTSLTEFPFHQVHDTPKMSSLDHIIGVGFAYLCFCGENIVLGAKSRCFRGRLCRKDLRLPEKEHLYTYRVLSRLCLAINCERHEKQTLQVHPTQGHDDLFQYFHVVSMMRMELWVQEPCLCAFASCPDLLPFSVWVSYILWTAKVSQL